MGDRLHPRIGDRDFPERVIRLGQNPQLLRISGQSPARKGPGAQGSPGVEVSRPRPLRRPEAKPWAPERNRCGRRIDQKGPASHRAREWAASYRVPELG
jgi:hypothetical protein